MSYQQTVAACVFQGHDAGHDCRECPLVQVLVRRVRDLGIEDSPAHVDRELDKYRSLARILNCPQLAKISLDHFLDVRVRGPHRTTTNAALTARRTPLMCGS
jgi:hypothetical protein